MFCSWILGFGVQALQWGCEDSSRLSIIHGFHMGSESQESMADFLLHPLETVK